VSYWRGQAPYPERLYTTDHKGYWYYVGGIFYVFGIKPLIPKLINCVAGALVVVLTYRITRMLFDAFSARLAAYFVTFFPSYILWSGLNLKDMPMVLFVLTIVWLTLKLQERFSVVVLAFLILALMALGFTRGYLVPIVGVAIVMSLLVKGENVGLAFLAAILVFGTFYFVVNKLGAGRHYVRGDILDVIQRHREVSAYGGSAYMRDVDVSDPLMALLYLPVGLAFFVFGPFPTSMTGPRQLMALPEILAFYILLPAIIRGLIYTVRYKFRQALILISILVLVTCTYSLGESNLGTAYRHRIQILALLLIMAGVGISLKRQARRQAESPALQT
jgi:4-amino-4-deoxy-L-arabinose transferase-like glycosyltransferase